MADDEEIVAVYLRHHREKDEGLFWAWQAVTDAVTGKDPQRGWMLVLRLLRAARDEREQRRGRRTRR